MIDEAKCPKCGAEIDLDATSGLRACRAKGTTCETVVYECGVTSDLDRPRTTSLCLGRQLAAMTKRAEAAEAIVKALRGIVGWYENDHERYAADYDIPQKLQDLEAELEAAESAKEKSDV